MALIDKRELIKNSAFFTEDEDGFSVCVVLENDIRNAPEVEVVRKEQYDKLRNTFLDFFTQAFTMLHRIARIKTPDALTNAAGAFIENATDLTQMEWLKKNERTETNNCAVPRLRKSIYWMPCKVRVVQRIQIRVGAKEKRR